MWHRRIGTGRCEGVGLRIPDLKVFEDSFDHIDIVDDAHVAAADNTRKRIDLVHLLNQPCPGGLATCVSRRLRLWNFNEPTRTSGFRSILKTKIAIPESGASKVPDPTVCFKKDGDRIHSSPTISSR